MITQQQFLTVANLLDNMLVICREHQLTTHPGEYILGDMLADIGGWVLHCKNRIHVCIHYITTEDVVNLLDVHVRRPLLQAPILPLEGHQVWAVERLHSMLDAWAASS